MKRAIFFSFMAVAPICVLLGIAYGVDLLMEEPGLVKVIYGALCWIAGYHVLPWIVDRWAP